MLQMRRKKIARAANCWQAALLAGAIAGTLPHQRAAGASLTWDPLSAPATGSDASGAWNNGSGIWSNGTADVSWDNSSLATAVFGAGGAGGPETVTLGTNISAGGLSFNPGPAYVLTGNPITLGGGSAINVSNNITIASDLYTSSSDLQVNVSGAVGSSLTVTGSIYGNYGVVKSGPGAVTLQGPNDAFAGNVNVSAGTLIATEGYNDLNNGSLGNGNVPGRTITIGSGATLLLTDGPDDYGADEFGNGAAGGIVNTNGTYTPDPNMPTIIIDGGTLNSTRYNPLGNVILNGGTLTQASTDAAYYGTLRNMSFYQGYQFIGSVAVEGASPSLIAATPNSVSDTIGGDHLGPNTIFNVAKTSTTPGTVDLVVSSPLIDQSDDFDIYTSTSYSYSPGQLSKTGPGTMSLTAANSYSGGTNVAGGTLIFAAPGALPIDTALSIGPGAIAMAANHGAGPLNTLFASSLSIAGATDAWTGKLDLSNNDLDVQNGSLAMLINQLQQGFDGGTWNGGGGIVSSAAAANTTHLTTLGIIQNSTTGSPTGNALYSSFDGTPVTSTDVLVKYTYYGDANLDGTVNASDYSRIDNGYLNHLTGWFNGDFNYDGVVNGSDYTLIDNAYNMQGASLAAVSATTEIAGDAAPIPEPSGLAVAVLGCAAVLRRRAAKQES